MVTNDSSATYPSPCAQRDGLRTSLLTQHHLLRTCPLYHIQCQTTRPGVAKLLVTLEDSPPCFESQTDTCPDVGSITVGEMPRPQTVLRVTLSQLPQGLLVTFSKEKISRTMPVLPAITTRGRPQDVATWQQGPEQCTPVYCSICTPVFSGVREECVPAHPGRARGATMFSLMATLLANH